MAYDEDMTTTQTTAKFTTIHTHDAECAIANRNNVTATLRADGSVDTRETVGQSWISTTDEVIYKGQATEWVLECLRALAGQPIHRNVHGEVLTGIDG